MKLLITLGLLCFSGLSLAQSKQEVSDMLKQLKAKGVFSEEQVKAAEKQLNGMSDSQFNGMIQKGKQKINDPEIQKKLRELQQ